jgi:heme exporter protein D
MNTSTLILVYVRIEGIYCNRKKKKNNTTLSCMINHTYSVTGHQIVSVNKKNAILVKENEQKRRKKKQKQKQTNQTTWSEQFQNSFEKSQKQTIESAHFPGLVHAY